MIKSKRKTRRGQKSARTGAFSDRSAVGHILSSPFTFFCSRTVFTATPSVSSRRFGYAVLAAAFPALPFPMPRRMFPLCRFYRAASGCAVFAASLRSRRFGTPVVFVSAVLRPARDFLTLRCPECCTVLSHRFHGRAVGLTVSLPVLPCCFGHAVSGYVASGTAPHSLPE